MAQAKPAFGRKQALRFAKLPGAPPNGCNETSFHRQLDSPTTNGNRARTFTDADIRQALERVSELSLLEEQLLFRLCCLSLWRGYAWMGQGELARLLRCSERTLRDAIGRVCDRGLLATARLGQRLSYLPQWTALGLGGDLPAKTAGQSGSLRRCFLDQQGDRQDQATAAGHALILSQPPAEETPASAASVSTDGPEEQELQAARAELAEAFAAEPPAPMVLVAALPSRDDNPVRSPAVPAVASVASCIRAEQPPLSSIDPESMPESAFKLRGERPGLAKALPTPLVKPATVDALIDRYGADSAQAVAAVFRARKWQRPGVAETACLLLLERGARAPERYVHSLFDEAEKRLDFEAEERAARAHDYQPPAASPQARSRTLIRGSPPTPTRPRDQTDAAKAFAAEYESRYALA